MDNAQITALPEWVDGVNCSIGCAPGHWREGLTYGESLLHGRRWRRPVELWWPFASPVVSDDECAALSAELCSRGLQLVALNLWGGDMPAGERGVLHEGGLPAGHLDCVLRISEDTGVQKFNLLLGRGGAVPTEAQIREVASIGERLEQAVGGRVLIEPLSGMPDYPVRSLKDARDVVHSAGTGGVLLDVYHLAVNAELGCLGSGAGRGGGDQAYADIAHVQVADAPGRGAPGTGALDLAGMVAELRAGGYRGDVMGEWLPA